MSDIHYHYDQLGYNEKAFVDEVFEFAFREARSRMLPLDGSDIAERAVGCAGKGSY